MKRINNHGPNLVPCGTPEGTDVYKTWTGVHGLPHGPGPWTTPWTTPNLQQEIAPVNIKI